MSDEQRNFFDESDEAARRPRDPNPAELPASTIFVEMMRQAAARRAAQSLPHATPQSDAAELAQFFLQPAPPAPAEPGAAPPTDAPTPAAPSPVAQAAAPDPATPTPETPRPATAPTRPERPRRARPPAEPTEAEPAASRPQPAPSAPADPAMQEQRIQRIQRRKERRRQRRAGMIGGFVRTALVVIIAALLTSTIFNFFTQPEFLDPEVASGLQIAQSTGIFTAQPTALPTPNWLRRIGIVSGHRGPQNDPGAVCPDGLTEAEINFAVAQIVVRNLRAQGYSVDLLDEFDPRLDNYQAAALVSIHANTCQDFGERVSGFLVAKAAARPEGGLDTLLAECIGEIYGRQIGLERRFSLTIDMTDYHTFREIHPLTPAAIIELGFMKDDREILTMRQDDMGQAITEGVLCFLAPRDVPVGDMITATPGFVPSPAPTATLTDTSG